MTENFDKTNPEDDFNAKLKAMLDDSEPAPIDEDEDFIGEEEEDGGLQELDVDLELQDEEEEPEETVARKPVSKQEAAIIKLRRELREQKELNRTLAMTKEQSEQKDSLAAKYISEGYEEDTAKYMADRDTKLSQIEQRLAMSEFKEDNAEVLQKYPNARKDMSKIMDIMSKTGFTAEQVCLSMYYDTLNPLQDRAKAAVTGKLQSNSADNTISRATGTAGSSKASLNTADRQKKQDFESKFGQVSDARFLELKEKFSL